MPLGMSVGFNTLTSPTFMLLMSLGLVTGGGVTSPPPPHATARTITAGTNIFFTEAPGAGFGCSAGLIHARPGKGPVSRSNNLKPEPRLKAERCAVWQAFGCQRYHLLAQRHANT